MEPQRTAKMRRKRADRLSTLPVKRDNMSLPRKSWWRLLYGTVDSSLQRSQRPPEWQNFLQAPLCSPWAFPLPRLVYPVEMDIVIFYLSAQKLNLLKNKLLCFILYLLMPFLRLQGFTSLPLGIHCITKSNTTCNGWGATCLRKRSGSLIHPPCNFPSLT